MHQKNSFSLNLSTNALNNKKKSQDKMTVFCDMGLCWNSGTCSSHKIPVQSNDIHIPFFI